MKKSCTAKESKEVSIAGTEHDFNDFTEASKDLLTEEQLLINKKLLESGIEDSNLGWLEKRNIYKTIAASLNSKDNKRHPHTRSTKAQQKWLVNSFENKNDKKCNYQENQHNLENSRAGSPILSIQTKKTIQGVEEVKLSSTNKAEVKAFVEKKPKNAESPNNILKSSKKLHFIKVELKGDPKEECLSSNEPEAKSQALRTNKKRSFCARTGETSKKFKMEETNNGIPSKEETPLKTELEMEKRKQNAPFKLRDIKSIVEECESRNEKWKETYSKSPAPARWGTPIVKNCEKWDGKQIPQKLLHRYQKYLASNNLTHPVFYPVKSHTSDDIKEMGSEIDNQSLIGRNSECRNESNIGSPEGRLFVNESNGTLETNLAASTSGDTCGRMVLRSRNQQKPIILDEEEYSSDEFDDWCSKKKKKTSVKVKKAFDQNNKQLFLKLEKCNINKRNGSESGRKNGNKNDVGLTGGSMQFNNSVNQDSKPGPDPDTMVCPICSLRFKKQLIESHATDCASKTYND